MSDCNEVHQYCRTAAGSNGNEAIYITRVLRFFARVKHESGSSKNCFYYEIQLTEVRKEELKIRLCRDNVNYYEMFSWISFTILMANI